MNAKTNKQAAVATATVATTEVSKAEPTKTPFTKDVMDGLAKQTNKSQKIRYLVSQGIKDGPIARYLGCSHQQVNNTRHRPLSVGYAPFIN